MWTIRQHSRLLPLAPSSPIDVEMGLAPPGLALKRKRSSSASGFQLPALKRGRGSENGSFEANIQPNTQHQLQQLLSPKNKGKGKASVRKKEKNKKKTRK